MLATTGAVLVGWLLVRWLRRRDGRSLLAAGVVAGLAAGTKFQVLLLVAVLLLALAAVGPRELCTETWAEMWPHLRTLTVS